MRSIIRSFALPLLFGIPCLWSADPAHGAQVLREQNCLNCHAAGELGSGMAPDLGLRASTNDTPAALASRIWNHMPIMAHAMIEDRVGRPQMSGRDAEDMFVYLYSLHFPDNHGDARRGREVFAAKNCAGCHSLNPEGTIDAKPVSDWKLFDGPFALIQEMWNHSSYMKNVLAKRATPVPSITGQELADLSAYIRALQQTRSFAKETPVPMLADPLAGKPLFDANCAQCHSQLVSLEERLSNRTITEIAADLWNHAPRMLAAPMMAPDDMGKITAYVWQLQYAGPRGTVAGGARVFADKGCITCHSDPETGEAAVGRGDKLYSPYSMISLGWDHDVRVQREFQKKGMAWPRLSPANMSDLLEFINSRP
jgi:mono/diheme cytochrome c family protein